MCLCGVWLRPNQSTMDRIRTAVAALRTPFYRTTVILLRGRKIGHNQWQMDHTATDARRGATKRHEYTSILDRWQKDEVYRASQLAHGWTETWVKYLDYISNIDISVDAPHWQRQRYESTVYMRGADFDKQAGPLCQRPDHRSSSGNALVSLQRAQGQGVPHIPIELLTRQKEHNGSRSPTTLFMVEFQLEDVFLVIVIIFKLVTKPNMVEFVILGPPIARMALSRVARQRVVGPKT